MNREWWFLSQELFNPDLNSEVQDRTVYKRHIKHGHTSSTCGVKRIFKRLKANEKQICTANELYNCRRTNYKNINGHPVA